MTQDDIDKINSLFIKRVHFRWADPTWRGIKIVKLPTDMILYQQEIWSKKPDFIIDLGTRFGGSALFFADLLTIIGKGEVISIDIKRRDFPKHPRIKYLTGNSLDNKLIQEIKDLIKDKSVMVVLDSDHTKDHVENELRHYSPIVTSGQWLVIEDCYGKDGKLAGPGEARDSFLKNNHDFTKEEIDRQFIVGYTRGGWLKKNDISNRI